MIGNFEAWKLKVRRIFSPNTWMIRLLRLPEFPDFSDEPGLVLVQIDGLAYEHFCAALKRGHMPFARQLHEKEHYRPCPFYSGIPSNTPSVQGELFYGVRRVVPAFHFRDSETGKIFKMYEREAASSKEEALKKQGIGLLEQGSSYGNIFAGGAGESHYTASTFGWGAVKKTFRPSIVGLFLLFNLHVVLKVAVLIAVEVYLAFLDFFRGLRKGYDLKSEFHFILTRVVVSIFLRELITSQVKMDIARGLPVIHLNFFGYDEQAHRRGPSSWFAYWSLEGIDSAIRRIAQEARWSMKRHYDIWIYSDHGQEDTVPYPHETGKSIERAIGEVYAELFDPSFAWENLSTVRGGCLCCPAETSEQSRKGKREPPVKMEKCLAVTAMGSLGHVYPPAPLNERDLGVFAEALVREARLPAVLAVQGGEVFVWTQKGKFPLEEGLTDLLPADHPYLKEVIRDTGELMEHPDSGPLVLLGWRKGAESLTFPDEHGSHGGVGPFETNGFVLLPSYAPLPDKEKKFLEPMDLREAALCYLEKSEEKILPETFADLGKRPEKLRIMTYNIHSCVGMDGNMSPERIGRVIARRAVDVVCLQEVDRFRKRTGQMNQVELIARFLGMSYIYQPVMSIRGEDYGNAVLSRYPMHLVRAARLPSVPERLGLEPRGALWVQIMLGQDTLHVINTHLSLSARERMLQAETLTGPSFLGHEACRGPIVLCGDLNTSSRSSVGLRLEQVLRNVQLQEGGVRPLNTWAGRYPLRCLDHIYVSKDIEVLHREVPRTELEKNASDHLPLLAEIRILEHRASNGIKMGARIPFPSVYTYPAKRVMNAKGSGT